MMGSLGSLDSHFFSRINYRKISLLGTFQGVTCSRHVTLESLTATLPDSGMIGRNPLSLNKLFSGDAIVA